MKKLFALLAVVLAVVSCQKDADLDVNVGDEQLVNITVALPEATRADSAQSGWANTGEVLRVILQIFDENGNTTDTMRFDDEKLTYGNTTVNYNVRLVPGHKYTFVAWADQGTEDQYFNTSNLKNVTFADGAWTAMNENIDAYTATETVEAGNSIRSINLVLTRPFAKVRVVTTDINAVLAQGWTPTAAVATYQETVPVSFNAFAGVVGETAPVVNPVRHVAYNKQYKDKTGEMTLFADYLYVPTSGTAKFEFAINGVDNNGNAIAIRNDIVFNTPIPAVRNKLTTIKGDILTNGSNIKVEVDEEFEQPGNTVFDAFERGGTVTLDKDYELGSTLYVESGVKATLNLNGKTLKSLYDANNYTDVIVVEEGAELTINGDGTIEAEGGKSNFTVIVDGKLTINGGTFKSGVDEVNDPNAVIYVRGNGEAYVNGGNFPNELNSKYILNKRDADRATTKIEVRGGRFQNFNPGNNAAENAGTNFLAAGYVSVANGEWFDVVKGATVASVEDFNAALDKAIEDKKEVIVVRSFSTSEPLVIEEGQIATINLNGKTITGAFFKDGGALIENNGTLKIVGGTLKNTYKNGDAVINNSGELVLEDVKIEGAPIADGGYPAYAVISSGKMIINDGTEVSSDRGCLKLSNYGETVINGGTFVNNDIDSRSLTSHVVDVEDGGSNKLTINGGTFEHRHATTNGGVVICNRTKGTVYVNGGNFSGGNYYGNDNLSDYGYGGTFSVTGGTYTAKPAPKYIANGYKVIEQDGKYVVVQE